MRVLLLNYLYYFKILYKFTKTDLARLGARSSGKRRVVHFCLNSMIAPTSMPCKWAMEYKSSLFLPHSSQSASNRQIVRALSVRVGNTYCMYQFFKSAFLRIYTSYRLPMSSLSIKYHPAEMGWNRLSAVLINSEFSSIYVFGKSEMQIKKDVIVESSVKTTPGALPLTYEMVVNSVVKAISMSMVPMLYITKSGQR